MFDSNNLDTEPRQSTSQPEEEIIFVVENNEEISTIDEPPKKRAKKSSTKISQAPITSTEECENNINLVNNPDLEEGTKRNITSGNKRKLPAAVLLNNKKLEILKKKMTILELTEQSERETLKGKKLDNDIKEIIKEREKIELRIKQTLLLE